MKQSFDDYECEGQMNINQWLTDLSYQVPFKCCDIEPWLHITKCYGGDFQTYTMLKSEVMKNEIYSNIR